MRTIKNQLFDYSVTLYRHASQMRSRYAMQGYLLPTLLIDIESLDFDDPFSAVFTMRIDSIRLMNRKTTYVQV